MSVRGWFERAQREGFAIGAFNVANLETFKAVVVAAEIERSPVLVESSDGETAYVGPDNLVDLVRNAREETGLPIFLNLDHSRDPHKVRAATRAGYDLVHYDGSKEPLGKNIKKLQALRRFTQAKHVLLEGEMDYIIEGSEVRAITAKAGSAQSQLTDPEQARQFVDKTAIDTLAVSIGNVHGLYTTAKHLDFYLLKQIRSAVSCFLSLHGGSGISDSQIRQVISLGRIVKINISTELRQALRSELEKDFKKHPREVAMYKLTPPAIVAVQTIVQKKMRLFGSAGKA